MLSVTPVYASILTLVFIYLSFRVIGMRRNAKVSLGDGGEKQLQARARAHANFAEYVPLCLLLMLMAELQGLTGWTLHLIGALLLMGRLSHAYSLSLDKTSNNFRVVGMISTFAALVVGALSNLSLSLLAG